MKNLLLLGALALTACTAPTPEAPRALAAEPTAPPAPVHLVAIGASDLVGVGATRPEQEGWAPVLATLLPGETRLTKLGVSGATAGRLKAEVSRALAARPDAVVLWTGVNDYNAQVPLNRFTADLDGMLAPLAATGADLYVVNLPDLDRLPAFKVLGTTIRATLPAWQDAVRTSAARHRATVVELTPYSDEIAANPGYISGDGFHPSTRGYRRVAEIVADAMTPRPPLE